MACRPSHDSLFEVSFRHGAIHNGAHILITVQGGVAEVCEDTVPSGVVVEILDFDNLAADREK
jgi:hypothetical protein